jgi:hypothetical protein
MTLLGIVTLVRLVQYRNALSQMSVTGTPLIVLGIVTAPPGPVYPVMAIVPSQTMEVNWACTAIGSANSSSSALKHVFIAHFGFPEKGRSAFLHLGILLL